MFVNEEALAKGREPDALFVFIHCQRTGGSNFGRWLSTNFDEGAYYGSGKVDNYVQWADLQDIDDLAGKKVVVGFSYFKLHETRRPLVFIGNVRHPAYRIISLMRLARVKEDHFLHDLCDLAPVEFYRQGRKRKPWYFDNLQTRRLANGYDVDRAIENIQTHFGCVGTTDELSGTSAFLRDFYGWTQPAMEPFAGPPDATRYAGRIDAALLEELTQNNSMDLRLYEFVAGRSAAEAARPEMTRPEMTRPEMNGEKPVTQLDLAPIVVAPGLTVDDSEATEERQQNPHTGFSSFFMKRVAERVADGSGHNSLGANLVRDGETRGSFLEAGLGKANRIMHLLDVDEDDRVVDYGCGSLRLGVHFINRLKPNSFFGLDVTDAFFKMGVEMIGADTIAQKQPTLAVISPETVRQAADFSPTCLYSSSVCMHVHPDEIGFYFDSLQRIVARPGARLVFDATVSATPVRFSNRSWAWPLEWLEEQLPELEHRQTMLGKPIIKNNHEVAIATLVFRRAERKNLQTRTPAETTQARTTSFSEVAPSADLEPGSPQTRGSLGTPEPLRQAEFAGHAPAAEKGGRTRTPAKATYFSKEFVTPVDPAFGFSHISVSLGIPEFPTPARLAAFACHALDATTGEPTDRIVATFEGGLIYSDDLGDSWSVKVLSEDPVAKDLGIEKAEVVNAFVTADGSLLAQVKAPPLLRRSDVANAGAILRFDRDMNLLAMEAPGHSHWHGSRSIDQSGDTIIYAEYPSNKAKYRLKPGEQVSEKNLDLRNPGVYRSRDGGRSWEKVFEKSWKDIRHFHTVAADPYDKGVWWLSSGDTADESRVWRSLDDGDTWQDVSEEEPGLLLHPSIVGTTRSVFRYTDIWIGEKTLIWGADDWLGGQSRFLDGDVPMSRRAGSRLFLAEKGPVLRPRALGFVGNPIRSMVELDKVLLVTTEAKHSLLPRPQVFLVSKDDPELCAEIFTIDTLSRTGTGFTFSRASRRARNNVFFSYRSRYDLADLPARTLRWSINLH